MAGEQRRKKSQEEIKERRQGEVEEARRGGDGRGDASKC